MVKKKIEGIPEEVEVIASVPGLHYPKGPCPILKAPCVCSEEGCGFWRELLMVETTVLGTSRPVIVGSCVFFATFSAASSPVGVAIPPQSGTPGGRRGNS